MGSICHNRGMSTFGSLANVRLTGDDVPEHQNTSAVIFYPDTNSNSTQNESNFEVKERCAEISKGKTYGRTDTLGNGIGEPESESEYIDITG